jgi:MerR family transcriptional regulator, repressor of the yfmOP operon
MDDENDKNDNASVSPDTADATAASAHHERNERDEQDEQDEARHLLSIDEVAKRTDLSKPTLRFYEQKGLVEPPARLPGKFRKYSSQDLEQLERVKQLRDLLGLSLTEIEETLKLDKEHARLAEQARAQWDAANDTTVMKNWLDEARRLNQRQLDDVNKQLGAVEGRIEGLQRLRDEIQARKDRIDDLKKGIEETERELDEAK